MRSPAFLPTVGAPARTLDTKGVSGTGFGILGFGDLTVPMNAHSGRPEIAPYPGLDGAIPRPQDGRRARLHDPARRARRQLGHSRSQAGWNRCRASMRRAAATTGSMRGGAIRAIGPPALPARQGHLEHRAEPGDIAHQPSLAFVPYLITGDRFFADEMAYWANFCLIGSFASDDNRKGAQWPAHRQRSARHRLGAAQHGRCGGVPARRESDEGVSRGEGLEQPHRSGHIRRDVSVWSAADPVSPAPARRRDAAVPAVHVDLVMGTVATSRGRSIA